MPSILVADFVSMMITGMPLMRKTTSGLILNFVLENSNSSVT